MGQRALAELGDGSERDAEGDGEEERAAEAEARLGGAGAEERLHEEECGVTRFVDAVRKDGAWKPATGQGGNWGTVQGEKQADEDRPQEGEEGPDNWREAAHGARRVAGRS